MILIGWRGHTPDSRLLAESLREALIEHHGSEKAGAIALGLTKSQLSRQLAGVEPFNLFRTAFSPGLFATFIRIHAKKLGGSFLSAEEKNFILGCVGIGKKKMSRFLMDPSTRKESA